MEKKLALIVPYRDRKAHLTQFIPHMQKFLSHQFYQLFIIEQSEQKPFNRGMLLNIGFSLAEEQFDYVCFHDVDMLPVKADYSYAEFPTHLATHVEQFQFGMPYPTYFGGVTLFNIHDFKLINGYYNNYFGWGLEDDDLRLRCQLHGLKIDSREGLFLSLSHSHAKENDPNVQKNRALFKNFVEGNSQMLAYGLNSLKYKLIKKEISDDRIHILVEI